MISNDVTARKEETELLVAAIASIQDTAISSMISGIGTQCASLVTAVDSRMNLLEKSTEMHKMYAEEYRRCQEMIVSGRQQLQQIQVGPRDHAAAVQHQRDHLKVALFSSAFQSPVNCKLYADDVKLYTELKTAADESCFQGCLDLLYLWSVTWQLAISGKKGCIATIGKPDDSWGKPQHCLGAEHISVSDTVSDLRVTVDPVSANIPQGSSVSQLNPPLFCLQTT